MTCLARRAPTRRAAIEAVELGHNYVGTKHILLGLYGKPSGLAAQVLVRLGLDAEAARSRVVEVLSAYQPEE